MNHNNLPNGMMINPLEPGKYYNFDFTYWGLIKKADTI